MEWAFAPENRLRPVLGCGETGEVFVLLGDAYRYEVNRTARMPASGDSCNISLLWLMLPIVGSAHRRDGRGERPWAPTRLGRSACLPSGRFFWLDFGLGFDFVVHAGSRTVTMEPHGVGRPPVFWTPCVSARAARLPVGLLLFHTRSDWRLESLSGLTCCLNDAIRSNECSCVLPFAFGLRVGLTVVTWLILPVVICLSQRLSHACLSISLYTVRLRMAH